MANQAAVLAWAVRGARKADLAARSDRELLACFAESSDQEAFAALVARHSDMVFGVCRRSLTTAQDAEDACQAVFLVLARKARSGRWQASIANWLYSTARKIAQNARRTSVRRARREGAAAVPECVSPDDALSGREMAALLDEELEKLAPLYREPLVLCYLEGLTRDEAATRLGVPTATVKSQLERGRKKLADALIARGCALGVALLATSSARAVSPRLVQLILATAGGSPPAAVAALAQEVVVNSALSRMKWIFFFALGLATLSPLTARPFSAGDEKPASAKRDNDAKPDIRAVAGKVVNSTGRPVVADLLVCTVVGESVALGKTSADGTFRVTVPTPPTGAFLVAKANGHGLAFLRMAKDTPDDVTLTLPKDLPIRGRIIDPQGKPIAGAAVELRTVTTYSGGSMQPFLDAWKKRTYFRQQPQVETDTLYNTTALPFVATTDASGRFELAGVGAERLVCLKISGAGRAVTKVHVVTREGFDPKSYNAVTLGLRPAGGEKLSWDFNPILSAPDFTVAAESEKPLRGRLEDDAGRPRGGVVVALEQDDGINRLTLRATTDIDGRYVIRGAKKQPAYRLSVESDAARGYLGCTATAKDTVGYEPVVADLACAKGVVVTGKLRDKATGRPIVGRVRAVALAGNESAKRLAALGVDTSSDRKEVGADGTYRVVLPPGPTLLVGGSGKYGAKDAYRPARPDPRYAKLFHIDPDGTLLYHNVSGGSGGVDGNWCKVIAAKASDGVVIQDIELEPATRKTVRLEDADGRPVKGAIVTGINRMRWSSPEPLGDADRFDVLNLEPEEERFVAVRHAGRKLVGALTVKEADRDPVLKLGPGGVAKGRVVGAEGRPLAGVTVKLYFERREVAELYGRLNANREAVTDVGGAFEFDHLLPGYEFRLLFSRGKKALGPQYNNAAKHSIGRHGAKLEIGDVKAVVENNMESPPG